MGYTKRDCFTLISRWASLAIVLALVLPFANPNVSLASESDIAAADELGIGLDEASALNLSLEQACEVAGVEYVEPFDGSLEDMESDAVDGDLSVASLAPSKFQRLMAYALQYQGWKYVWGGKYPWQNGFDCSGLVTWCYDNALGATIDGWMTAAEKLYTDYCTPVSGENAKPGDLVFWLGTYGNMNLISHVGIYCGGNLCYAAGSPIGFYDIRSLKNINGGQAPYFFGSLIEVDDGDTSGINEALMYRLYNPNSGEHFYTASCDERDGLIRVGWKYEGIGWRAPKFSNTPVYRLYSGTDHHYTTSVEERNHLMSVGWKYEGIGWYSDDARGIPLYRQFNPYVVPWASYNNSGSHNYTGSLEEQRTLVALGWKAEGVAWYGVR